MHTARINRIGIDENETTLVTASNDKTVRVWDLKTGRLKKILRVPAGLNRDGRLYAVALSPDGKTVVAGGLTGSGSQGGYSIYIFDRSTGAIRNRLKALPDVIYHLTFSRDGRYLAASLGGANGVRIYNTADWSLKASDKKYGAACYWADFNHSNQLVTTSYDGHIRLYSKDFSLTQKINPQGGSRPFSAVFSPDGKKIAVGFSDSTAVNVLAGRDLSFLYAPNTSGIYNGDLSNVSWSEDGRRLFAGGRYYNETVKMCSIRQWTDQGKGNIKDLPCSSDVLMHILPLKDGGLVFGAGDPAWGKLNSRGRRTHFFGPLQADYRGVFQKGFLISGDGTTLRFGLESGGNKPVIFSVRGRTLTPNGDSSGLKPPVTKTDSLTITGWEDTFHPQLNGKELPVKENEFSRSLAIAPDRQSFLLGTAWHLQLFDRNGREKWKVPVQSAAWGVNISGDGKKAVAALGDGTIRWYRMDNGMPLLTLFPHKDKKRWVAWTPSGYYAASAGGEELIGWHVNRGRDHTPDFFPAAKFRSIYYRPEVIVSMLKTLNEKEALRLVEKETGRKNQHISLEKMYPPVVTILSPYDGASTSSTELTLEYSIRNPSGQPITAVKVLVDGRPLPENRGIKLKKITPSGQLSLSIPKRSCQISLIAENKFSASDPAVINLKWRGQEVIPFVIKPKLYVLSIGVSKYDRTEFQLDFPAKDARDIATALGNQEGGIYREVDTKLLENPDKNEVLGGLDWIEAQVTAKDVAVVFLAGHGVNDRNGKYHFLPANANPDNLRRTAVDYGIIRDVLSNLPGKVLAFIDTCHSGNVMGSRRGAKADLDKIAMDLASAENGVIVFASSTGSQYSLEDSSWNNGAFTKALVEGFTGKADYTKDKKITINELDLYLSERVKKLTNNRQTPTTSKPKTIQDFPVVAARG
jgi:WD40 repeat protein